MKIFVTGATGYIGAHLCQALAGTGHIVHALVRNPAKAVHLQHPNITCVPGHILDTESLEKGMQSCQAVFHLAACAKVWSSDPNEFYTINVNGTLNVLNAAVLSGISRVIITSTAGVFGPSKDDTAVNENTLRETDFFTEYERTKALADQQAVRYIEKGLELIFLHPTRVFGPGQFSKSNAVTLMISRYIQGKWHIIPADGKSIGNYVFVDDVVNGHVLALEKGLNGEHYILGSDNVSYNEFFKAVRNVSGKNYRLYHLPYFIMITAASIMGFLARFGIQPLITNGFVRKYTYHWINDSRKAIEGLGYRPVSLDEGIRRTIEWAQSK